MSDDADEHFRAGNALAAGGDDAGALGEWARTVQLDPGHVGAMYNLGQGAQRLGRHEEALRWWKRAQGLAPNDFDIARKIVQEERALGRWDDANHTMALLFDLWNRSDDPRIRALHEVVVDQFEVAGHRVLGLEMLRPRDDTMRYESMCQVFHRAGKLLFMVQLESSDYGRERGVPYVVGVSTPNGHRATGEAFAQKPSWRSFREIATRLIAGELRDAPPPG